MSFQLGNIGPAAPRPALPFGNRRRYLIGGMAAIACCATAKLSQAETPIRLGTTPVFLDDQLQLLEIWRADLQASLRRDVQFVQRRSYGEIVDLLLRGHIDAAWICGYPYVLNADRLRLLAVPQYRGEPLYQSYLIVPKADDDTQDVRDLRDRVFAYSDPLSNSGFLVPRTELISTHFDPLSFFRKTFFTFAHSKVVEAVSAGLASGGAVDGYVFDNIALRFPALSENVRVAWRSPDYGFPPIVISNTVASDTVEALQEALLKMHNRPDGRLILDRLILDRFVERGDSLYDGIRRLVQVSAGDQAGSEAT
ncbi:PhnD/SsuA/transferrin family substrate-binding protein [Bordetella tumulicola]|uniref:substrate-binding domain-containing protein n=1 Tax=Bordetella tumulicola TaxID=1649133 RepID=UPI0039EF2CF7